TFVEVVYCALTPELTGSTFAHALSPLAPLEDNIALTADRGLLGLPNPHFHLLRCHRFTGGTNRSLPAKPCRRMVSPGPCKTVQHLCSHSPVFGEQRRFETRSSKQWSVLDGEKQVQYDCWLVFETFLHRDPTLLVFLLPDTKSWLLETEPL
ncbi:hypothetical protein U0070_015324, partial [Myodes glareolus]